MPGPVSRAQSVVVELPFPPKELSPNARVHWRTKASVVAQYREDCAWAAHVDVIVAQRGDTLLDTPDCLDPPVEATVTFVVPDRRRRDLDNLLAMLKPAWDGLVDAGVLVGDDASQFKVADAKVEYRADLKRVITPMAAGYVVVELRGGGGTE